MTADPVAVYVHTPFCPSKCGYCDFNSFAMNGEIVERTVRAITQEIARSQWRGRPAKTVFFGGGTPTFLSSDLQLRILDAVFDAHPPVPGAEVTTEANPGTIDAAKFAALRSGGFNRLSMGAQSFVREDLVRLGRVHRALEIGHAVRLARDAGFENLNLDLMFALPGQSLERWEWNLQTAFSLKPEHLSLYCLTIEPNTRFYKLNRKGMLDLPDDEAQVAMYDASVRLAAEAGYALYEISNYAKPGRECRHNVSTWRGEEYLAYGPGAVGCFEDGSARTRYTNMKHPERYCQAIENGSRLWCESETVDSDSQRLERIMLGLRLSEGIERSVVGSEPGLRRCIDRGWVGCTERRVWLTPAGRHFCNQAVAEISG